MGPEQTHAAFFQQGARGEQGPEPVPLREEVLSAAMLERGRGGNGQRFLKAEAHASFFTLFGRSAGARARHLITIRPPGCQCNFQTCQHSALAP